MWLAVGAPIDEFFRNNVKATLAGMKGVRDGDAEAIHDVRVASRRIRAALPLLTALDAADVRPLRRAIRRLGRALGRARDSDVALELAAHLERRLPAMAGAIAPLVHDLREEQSRTRRRVIRRVEALPLPVLDAVASGQSLPGLWSQWSRARLSETAIRRRLSDLAARLRNAIERAGGVYFAGRTHDVRIRAKKLRYLLEMASMLRMPNAPRLKVLKRVQQVLGDVHDRQMLLDRLDNAPDEGPQQVAGLRTLISAERDALFAEYLRLRPELVLACDAAARLGRERASGRVGTVLTAAAVAVPSALVLLRRAAQAPRESARSPLTPTARGRRAAS